MVTFIFHPNNRYLLLVDSAQPPHTEGAGINQIALAHFPCQCSPFTHENSWLTLTPTGSHPVIRRIKAQGSKQVSCAVPTLLIVKERACLFTTSGSVVSF